jgi:hypothetical protein
MALQWCEIGPDPSPDAVGGNMKNSVKLSIACIAALLAFGIALPSFADETGAICKSFNIDLAASQPLHPGTATTNCKVGKSMGFPVPDPKCTPGAVNPSVTVATLRDPRFKPECVHGEPKSAEEKAKLYAAYGLTEPEKNAGPTRSCELNRLVPLELGGANGTDNIWPLCGPPDVMQSARYFNDKDKVDRYLVMMVKMNRMELDVAQKGVVTDWTQYLEAARKACLFMMCSK